MSDDDQEERAELLDAILDDYLDRRRRSESIAISYYLDRYPHLADELRKLLPLAESLDLDAGAPPSIPQTPLAPGMQLGNYRILREIGCGGMGIVYEATQKGLDRIVALKVLPESMAGDTKAKMRFLREARLSSTLQHPNIVPIYEPGEDQGRLFYSMQRIDGRPLAPVILEWRLRRLSRLQPWPKSHWYQIAQWIHDAADAVAAAHHHGILHRDIKPSNFLVDSSNRIWLCDFGLAKSLASDQPDTTNDLRGTLRYMSPEGLHAQYTPQSDVYGLGVTLHELLGLFPKYNAQTPASLYQSIIAEEGVRLTQIDSQIPKDLITISEKATAFSLKRRYQTAVELRDELRRFLHDQPILARSGGIADQCERWIRNNQSLAFLLATAIAFLVGITLLTSYYAIDSRQKELQTRLALAQATNASIDQKISLASQVALLGRHDSRSQAESMLQEAFSQMKDSNRRLTPRTDIQRVITEVLSIPDLRVTPETNAPVPDPLVLTACDPQYRRIVVSDGNGNTQLYSLPDWRLIHTFPKSSTVTQVSISPDGKYAAIGLNKTEDKSKISFAIQCWDIEAQPPKQIFHQRELATYFSSWSHQGDILFCVRYDGSIVGLAPGTGEEKISLEPSGPLREVDIYPHPRDPIIAVVSYFYDEIHFRDLSTGDTLSYPCPLQTSGFSWHPSGDFFCITPFDTGVQIVEWPSGRLLRQLEANHEGGEPSFSPDGKWLAVSYWGGEVELIDCATLDRIQRGWAWQRHHLRWSQDSRTLAIQLQQGKFHRLELLSPEGHSKVLDLSGPMWDVNPPVMVQNAPTLLAKPMSRNSRLNGIGLSESNVLLQRADTNEFPILVASDDQSRIFAIDLGLEKQKTYVARIGQRNELEFRLQKVDDLPFPFRIPRASGDGRFLFSLPSYNQLIWWPAADPTQADAIDIEETKFYYPSGTGRWVALRDENERITSVIERDSGQIAYRPPGDEEIAFFSPDDRLLFLSPSNTLLETQQWQEIADLPDAICDAAAFSPNNSILVRGDRESHDLLFYSLEEKKEIFEFNVTPMKPRHLQFTENGRKLILALDSPAHQGLRVLDFHQLATASERLFPEVPYIPDALLRMSPASTLSGNATPPTVRRINIVDQPDDSGSLDPTSDPDAATAEHSFAALGKVSSLDPEELVHRMANQLRDRFTDPQRKAIEAWDRHPESISALVPLNRLAQALANAERYEEAIRVSERALKKFGPNFNAKMIQSYSLWKLQRPDEAIGILESMGSELPQINFADFYRTALATIIQRSQNASAGSRNFLEETAPTTHQHPTFRLYSVLAECLEESQSCNLYDLSLALAEELIAQNDRIPEHWQMLAMARLQRDDAAGARQATARFVELKNHKRLELKR
jgi:serine/threonine protein kinase/tetratricopeptide (TPR) repeat protein